MEAQILNKTEYNVWDNFVDESFQGSIYSKSYYLNSIGCSFDIYTVEENSRIIAGIILSKNEIGIYSNSLFVKYLGILYGDSVIKNKSKSRNKIDQTIIDIIPKNKAIIYSFHPNYNNWLNFYWNDFSQTTLYTNQIKFENEGSFRNNYHGRVKGSIKKAIANRLKIVDVDIDKFCLIVEKTFKGRGNKMPISKKKLEEIIKKMVNYDCIYLKGVIDEDDNIHSVASVVFDKNSANLILNGSDPLYLKFSGNSLLIDHMIEFSSGQSKLFDFEGSMHRRIQRFYSGFGGQLTPYYVIYKNNFKTKFYKNSLSLIKSFYK